MARHSNLIEVDGSTETKLKRLISRIANAQHMPVLSINYVALPTGITQDHFTKLRLRASNPIALAVKECNQRLNTFSVCQFIQTDTYWLWGIIPIPWRYHYIVLQNQ